MMNIILESSSMMLVNALKSDAYDQSPGGLLFRETRFQ